MGPYCIPSGQETSAGGGGGGGGGGGDGGGGPHFMQSGYWPFPPMLFCQPEGSKLPVVGFADPVGWVLKSSTKQLWNSEMQPFAESGSLRVAAETSLQAPGFLSCIIVAAASHSAAVARGLYPLSSHVPHFPPMTGVL